MASAETKRGTQVMTGADILVKSLVDHNVEVIFAYPGGCSMPMHQSLTKYGDKLRTILPRHEQGVVSLPKVLPVPLEKWVW